MTLGEKLQIPSISREPRGILLESFKLIHRDVAKYSLPQAPVSLIQGAAIDSHAHIGVNKLRYLLKIG
jgi:hypothetical protein